MFLGGRYVSSTISVRRSGIQLELYHSRTNPLLRTERAGVDSSIYKHLTPNGVKPVNCLNDRH